MTKKEFAMVAVAIKAAYPTAKVLSDDSAMNLWYRMLSDLPYKLCETALFELFATHTFPPSIAEIRDKCAEYASPPQIDEGQAWGEVERAIGSYGIYRAEDALASMSPNVRKAVERIGFREICLDENIAATRAHFFRVYSAISNRERQDALLPLSVTEEKLKYLQAAEEARPENVIEQKPEEVRWLPDDKRPEPDKVDQMIKDLKERMRFGG